jgi:acid stress-induced BolA-like protein IbaG/YrbA
MKRRIHACLMRRRIHACPMRRRIHAIELAVFEHAHWRSDS